MRSLDIITEQDAEQIGLKIFKQHNAITSGRYDFTSCQLDIIFMLLSSLTENQLTYRIHAKDIELLTGRSWNYQQLKTSTQDIGSRMFEIETDANYKQIWLFQSVEYLTGQGAFEVMISEPAKPLFFELKSNFTHFQLKSVLGCTSKFAKRLYMLACQWRTVGKFPRPIPIIELKKILGLVDKKGNEQYSQIGQFKADVLEIAKTQINEHTDIHFDYELFKKGRSFEYIQIFVNTSKNKPEQLEIDFKKDVQFQKDVRNVMAYDIAKEHAELIAKDGYDKFLKFIEDVNARVRQGKLSLDNSAAYIVGAYQKKGVLSKNK